MTEKNEISEENYKYYAFISYSRKDERMARWIQKKLEAYRLPTVLQRQHKNLPKKLKIFRDKTDIGIGDSVENAISRELADSKKLIVICSPNSACSNWVDLEITNFLNLGRTPNDILPFVIKGIIDAQSKQNCYTPKLLELNINAADSTHEKKANAFIRLLSSLLEIKYDDLMRRERVRSIRKKIRWGLLAAFVSFCILVSVPYTVYYKDYTTKWGEPVGIEKIPKHKLKSYYEYYAITKQYLKTIQLVHKNSMGIPVEESSELERQNRPMKARYYYEGDSKFLKQVIYTIRPNDLTGSKRDYQIILSYTWNANHSFANIDFYYNSDEHIPASISNDILSDKNMYYADVSFLTTQQKAAESADYYPEIVFLEESSAIFRHKAYYDEQGFNTSVFFYNKNNQPVCDKNGINGYKIKHDKMGRITLESYNFDVFQKNSDIASKEYRYDEKGNLTSVLFHPVSVLQKSRVQNNTKRGFAYKKILWNEDGTCKEIAFFDGDKNPTEIEYSESIFTHSGNALFFTYDHNMLREKTTSLYNDGSKGIAEYDLHKKLGLITEYKYSLNDKLTNWYTLRYDDDAKVSEIIQYNEMGNKKYIENIRYSYDSGGNLFVESQISQGDDSWQDVDIFDKCGRLIENKYIRPQYVVQAKINYVGDNRSICYFENNEYFVPKSKGYARADFTFNNNGRLVYAAFKDAEGNPTECKLFDLGFATYTATYSANNNLLREEFFNENDEYITSPRNCYAYYIAETDIDDNFLREGTHYSADGRKCDYFTYSKKANGEVIVDFYDSDLGKKTKQILYTDNTIKYEHTINYLNNGNYEVYQETSVGNLVGYGIFSSDGNLVDSLDKGYAYMLSEGGDDGSIVIRHFSSKNICVSETYYDSNEKPIKAINYDEAEKIAKYVAYDYEYKKDGSYMQIRRIYIDDIENLQNPNSIFITYFNKYAERELNDEGWSEKRIFYDADLVTTEYYDIEGCCIPLKSNYLLQIVGFSEDSLADKNGVLPGDILLEVGYFFYFNGDSIANINRTSELGMDSGTRTVLFRPKTEEILSWDYPFGFDYKGYRPYQDDEANKTYILRLKQVYDDWAERQDKNLF